MVNNSFSKVVAWLKKNAPYIIELSFTPEASDSDIAKLKSVSEHK